MSTRTFNDIKREFLSKRPVIPFAVKKLMLLADNKQHAKNIHEFELFKQETLKVIGKKI